MSQKKAWEAKGFIERSSQSAKDREITMKGKKKLPTPKKSKLGKQPPLKGLNVQKLPTVMTSSGSMNALHFTYIGTQWIGTMADDDSFKPIELVLPAKEQIDPIRVFKLAKLRWAGERINLQGVGIAISYDVDDTARCAIADGAGGGVWYIGRNVYGFDPTKSHEAPEPKCSCGFHGVEEKYAPQLQVDYGGCRYVRVEAELFGRVVRHARGYRAQRQRVLSVAIPRRCRTLISGEYGYGSSEIPCSNQPDGLRIDAGEIVPSCATHAPFGSIPPTDVARMLGCQVRWFDAEVEAEQAKNALQWSDITKSV